VRSAALVESMLHALFSATTMQLPRLRPRYLQCVICVRSWARLQVVAVGTKTGAPTMNVLAVLAITESRQPHASDLGVREAAADSPVGPLPPIAGTAYPSPHS
jgi:hypothetical protein